MEPMDEVERKARLAYALRSARERREITPPQLAERLGVGRGTVNDWENPQKSAAPSILMLGQLCEVLGVDANLFAVLPPIPRSPVDDFLVDEVIEEAAARAVSESPSELPADADRAGKPDGRSRVPRGPVPPPDQ